MFDTPGQIAQFVGFQVLLTKYQLTYQQVIHILYILHALNFIKIFKVASSSKPVGYFKVAIRVHLAKIPNLPTGYPQFC